MLNTGRNKSPLQQVFKNVYLMMGFYMFLVCTTAAGQDVVFETRVMLPKQTSTVYSLLNQISRQSGYHFIYDSRLINNDRMVSIKRKRLEIKQLLDIILDDEELRYRVIQNHILIYKPQDEGVAEKPAENEVFPENPYFIVRGNVIDQISGQPMAYATVGVPSSGLGISTNLDGFFLLKLPLNLLEENLRISFLGYQSQEMPLSLLRGRHVDVLMENDIISMQEVIIRAWDPLQVLLMAVEKTTENYSQQPVSLFSFYREGVMRGNRVLNYSEALFRIYKAPVDNAGTEDQVLLLKARNFINDNEKDTLVLKLKAGVQSILALDIIKNPPDFLDESFLDSYIFTAADIVTRNHRNVFAVEFAQKPGIPFPLYQGIIYIDIETKAILEADFEINPKLINLDSERFFSGRMRGYNMNIDKAAYSVNYQYFNGRYHLNWVRGDLKIRSRKKRQVFWNNYSVFFEMAVSHIDTQNAEPIHRKHALRTHTIFVDQAYVYDEEFWGPFNTITPEANINEALSSMRTKIESLLPE
jgi:hypothetical protein